MSEEYQDPSKALDGLLSMAQRMGAQVMEAAREPRWEYRIVFWDDVNPLARAGWELLATDLTLTRFLMARKLTAADEAADLLKDA